MMKILARRFARPYRNKAKVAQHQGRWAEALAHLFRARSIDMNNPAITIQIANMHTELAQFDEATVIFEAVGSERGYALRAAVGLAGVAERRLDWQTAVDRWEVVLVLMAADETQTLEVRPLSPALVLLHSAMCREKVGDGSGAIRDLGLAMSLEPTVRHEREAILMRARILERSEPRKAYRMLKQAYGHYPADRTILFELTRSTVLAGDRREAANYATLLLKHAPNDPGALGLIRDYNLAVDEPGVG